MATFSSRPARLGKTSAVGSPTGGLKMGGGIKPKMGKSPGAGGVPNPGKSVLGGNVKGAALGSARVKLPRGIGKPKGMINM